MNSRKQLLSILGLFVLVLLMIFQGRSFYGVFFVSDLPASYDLRQELRSPSIREQSWGTCWIFSTYLSLESNLMGTDIWSQVEEGEPHLAPYHLDKYSGFTRRGDDSHVNDTWYSGQGANFPGSNTDDLSTGLVVHLGGDFLASSAFLTNTRGAVQQRLTPTIPRGGNHKLFGDLATEGVLLENQYTYFFPKHIEWLTLEGTEKQKRERIKRAIIKYGAVASSQVMINEPMGHAADGLEIHASLDPEAKLNHAVNLIGWNDHLRFGKHRGAWLAQDSDHRNEETGEPVGVFYILYDDVYAAKDSWMGGVSFRDIVIAPFERVYSHALHGFRYSTKEDRRVLKVANIYEVKNGESVVGVGIYTLAHNVTFQLSLKSNLEDHSFFHISGRYNNPGFHYIEVPALDMGGRQVVVELELDHGGYAYDASFEMEVLLGALPEWGQPVDVHSHAMPGEGFYYDAQHGWLDFSQYINPYNKQATHLHAKNHPTASLSLNLYTKGP